MIATHIEHKLTSLHRGGHMKSQRLMGRLVALLGIGAGVVTTGLSTGWTGTAQGSSEGTSGSVVYSAGAQIACPAVVTKDVNGDGRHEMFVTSLDGRIHAFDADGVSLPGWPVPYPPTEAGVDPEVNGISRSAPTVADLDGDGVDEVIVLASNYVYAWNLDGQLRWLYSMGFSVQGNSIRPSPVVADIDRDGTSETIVVWYSKIDIIDSAGGHYAGSWPKSYYRVFSNPAVADLDEDGVLEIVMSAVTGSSAPYTARHEVWHHDGSSFGGNWAGNTYDTVYSFIDIPPAVADLDGDGILDVIAPTYNNVYVYDRMGNLRPGWPQSAGRIAYLAVGDLNRDESLEVAFGWVSTTAYLYDLDGVLLWTQDESYALLRNSPTIADLDGDLNADCVLSDGIDLVLPHNGWIRAYGYSGASLPGMPLEFAELLRTATTVEDMDGDGLLELVYAFDNGDVHVHQLATPHRKVTAFWPQYLHDPAHTSFCPGTTIFRNGFESGDTSVWSATVP